MNYIKLSASNNRFCLTEEEITPQAVTELCKREKTDGVLVVKEGKRGYFMRIFNSDGSEAEMCGNGARCAAFYLKEKGFGRDVKFYTKSGKIRARVSGKSVKVSVGTPKNLRLYIPIEPMIHFVEVGVPHAVIFCDVESADVENVGRRIRYHKVFGKDGTNCNFVQLNEKLRIRTYERGVEAETGSCGTGAAAAAFISHTIHNIQFPVEVEPTSKESFYVDFEDGMLFIEGEVRTE